ncbi:CoxG family protein [Acidovorax cavernicola]|uniref:4-hydroxybenzoyl-CoA reductase n=1 Tax=Acidovorax cavernicola TaxID=1675792 RepID=A0A9X8CYB8_9BURK|nr:SRPBCC family protein [Acidovorax cavernicola]RIX71707.1 4-hydroxybenzoyl-CoA reductase [Acidovorax cavernicola]
MEIEKTLTVSAPPQQVWDLLLNPQIMAGAVPGMKSIDVISPTEYVAEMHQKISFISAKFKLKTKIVEQKAPEYMRVEGTGEDASVASSLKQTSEVFLTPAANGGTDLRIKVSVDVLGRLGAFGLSVMKTKADRLWEEFGSNLAARIEAGGSTADAAHPATVATVATVAALPMPSAKPAAPRPEVKPACASTALPGAEPQDHMDPAITAATQNVDRNAGWWSRVFGRTSNARSAGQAIRVEVRQMDKTICVEWPVAAASECREWLKSLQK